jgi:hypothetical protein
VEEFKKLYPQFELKDELFPEGGMSWLASARASRVAVMFRDRVS